MNSPDNYDNDLALVLNTAGLNELANIEAKLIAPTPSPVPTRNPQGTPNPNNLPFDLLDPTFNVIILHLCELDANVTGRKAAAANR